MAASISTVRTMSSPRKAAVFLQENFDRDAAIAEVQKMLEMPALIPLAHGIAVEMKIAESEELKEALVTSLKLSAEAVSVGYGGLVERNVSESSPFAGKGPMFAQMGVIDD